MKKLIKMHVRNIFHSKMFYVCTGIELLVTVVFSYLSSLGSKADPAQVFPQVVDYFSSGIGLIASIFIALFCCLDFSEGTTKNIIARGYTRTKLLLSKYIASLVGIFSMYGIIAIAYFLLFIKNGFGYDFILLLTFIESIFCILAYTVFYGTMSFLLEKNGSAIIACLIVPNVIPLVLTLIDSRLKLKVSDFWMDAASITFKNSPTTGNLLWSILYYLVYTIIFAFIGINVLKKKEIK